MFAFLFYYLRRFINSLFIVIIIILSIQKNSHSVIVQFDSCTIPSPQGLVVLSIYPPYSSDHWVFPYYCIHPDWRGTPIIDLGGKNSSVLSLSIKVGPATNVKNLIKINGADIEKKRNWGNYDVAKDELMRDAIDAIATAVVNVKCHYNLTAATPIFINMPRLISNAYNELIKVSKNYSAWSNKEVEFYPDEFQQFSHQLSELEAQNYEKKSYAYIYLSNLCKGIRGLQLTNYLFRINGNDLKNGSCNSTTDEDFYNKEALMKVQAGRASLIAGYILPENVSFKLCDPVNIDLQPNKIYKIDFSQFISTPSSNEYLSIIDYDKYARDIFLRDSIANINRKKEIEQQAKQDSIEQEGSTLGGIIYKICNCNKMMQTASEMVSHEKKIAEQSGYEDPQVLREAAQIKMTAQDCLSQGKKEYLQLTNKPFSTKLCTQEVFENNPNKRLRRFQTGKRIERGNE